MFRARETQSLDAEHRSLLGTTYKQILAADTCSSYRRYDERWGAAERSDTRLKCADGVIHNVHSQVLCLWSPILRCIIASYPAQQLLESTHGLAYLLHVDGNSQDWTALLDFMYPVAAQSVDWDTLERCLLLADKYAMSCLLQRLSSHLSSSNSNNSHHFSLDPAQPNFALRWLSLAERLQLLDVQRLVLTYLEHAVPTLASQPEHMQAILSYAQQHLSKQQLTLLLQLALRAANNQQQQQVPVIIVQMQHPMLQQQQPPTCTGCGWYQLQQQQHGLEACGVGGSAHKPQTDAAHDDAGIAAVQYLHPAPLLPLMGLPLHEQGAFAAAAASSCSAALSSSTPHGSSSAAEDTVDSSSSSSRPEHESGNLQVLIDTPPGQQLTREQQRLVMSLSAHLCVSASDAEASTAAESDWDMVPQCRSTPVTTPTAGPVHCATAVAQHSSPDMYRISTVSVTAATDGLEEDNSSGFAGFRSFGRGAYAGSMSIADWMESTLESQQPDIMIS